MLSKDIWQKVIQAIEDATPLYDRVNEIVSLGNAQKARSYAIEKLELKNGVRILDAGIGPGNTSKLALSRADPALLVGLDESAKQLKTARMNLGELRTDDTAFVRGVFESLPFKDGVFDAVMTSYALRDSLSIPKAVDEYSRVCGPNGRFAIVDIGKPDNRLKRLGSILYVKYIMPLIARIAIRGRMKSNPWRMIVPTYVSLPTTHIILGMVEHAFSKAELREFLMGGVIVILAEKS